ncbi:alpha-hydroxy acid oxidase [Zobellella aerophila]|uniref:Alpha-hydroxy-acid oxidizing protein n=1 Tax=Zobellella aerophila TaxID=870480 RepID=A0ABP6UZQ2_9GAMM
MSDKALMRRFPSSSYLEQRAAARLPNFVFDYLQGGSGRQCSLGRNITAFEQLTLTPRYFNDCEAVSLGTRLFGRHYQLPFGIAPIGLDGLIRPGTVEYLAQAARRAGCPVTASTFATSSLEEVARLAGEMAWFQLYPFDDGEIEQDMMARAGAAGYRVLMVTVDVPVGGRRELDMRNGLSLPPRLGGRTLLDVLRHPGWALRHARRGMPGFKNLQPYRRHSNDFLPARISGRVPWARLAQYRKRWPGRLLVKGVLRGEDAVRCRELGIDGLVISNHGGRQLDACPSTLAVLPEIRRAVGDDFPLIIDSGLRSGLDVARAIAQGADFALLGRTFIYGVAALGQAGAGHVIEMLRDELENAMQMLGCPDIAALKCWHKGDAALPDYRHGEGE